MRAPIKQIETGTSGRLSSWANSPSFPYNNKHRQARGSRQEAAGNWQLELKESKSERKEGDQEEQEQEEEVQRVQSLGAFGQHFVALLGLRFGASFGHRQLRAETWTRKVAC